MSIGADTLGASHPGSQRECICVYPPHSLLEANKAEVMKFEIKWWRRYIEKSALEMILDDA